MLCARVGVKGGGGNAWLCVGWERWHLTFFTFAYWVRFFAAFSFFRSPITRSASKIDASVNNRRWKLVINNLLFDYRFTADLVSDRKGQAGVKGCAKLQKRNLILSAPINNKKAPADVVALPWRTRRQVCFGTLSCAGRLFGGWHLNLRRNAIR